MPRDGSHAQNAPELGDDNHNIIHGAGKEPTVSPALLPPLPCFSPITLSLSSLWGSISGCANLC